MERGAYLALGVATTLDISRGTSDERVVDAVSWSETDILSPASAAAAGGGGCVAKIDKFHMEITGGCRNRKQNKANETAEYDKNVKIDSAIYGNF